MDVDDLAGPASAKPPSKGADAWQRRLPSPRQTLSYLQQLLAAHGIEPKKKLGQNFLIDLNLIDLLVHTAELTRDDLVMEVGAGTGGLTARICEEAGSVISVELDPAFIALIEATIGPRPHLHLIHADILKHKNELNPTVLDALAEARKSSGCKTLKLVSNLPYVVATPVIANFLMLDLPFERMVVTTQWEIAEKLIAQPDHKEFGALALLVQSLADVEVVRKLPPGVFYPRPKVESAIVLIRPNAAKRARIPSVPAWRAFLRDLYVHRRKNLRGALVGWPSGRKDKGEVDRKLAELGIPGSIRAEDLDLEQHLRLCAAFGAAPASDDAS